MAYKKSGKIVGPGAGTAVTPAANVPGIPTFVSQATGSINITWSENGNSSVASYCVYVEEAGIALGFLQVNTTVGSGEIFQTKAVWGATTVPVTGLTEMVAYKFKVKAKDEAGVETAYCSLSATMATLVDLSKGPTSDNVEREVTGGDTRIYGTPTWTGTLANAGTENVYYGDILVSYVLQNDDSETSSITASFSEDYSPTTELGTWASITEGAGGHGLTGLTSTPAGVTHIVSFDSDASCGTSDVQSAVYLKLTPKDADADAGTAIIVGPFGIDNLPAKMTWTLSDGKTWNKDTTPTFQAVLPSLRAGVRAFPALTYYRKEDGAGATVNAYSYQSITGWEYETALNTWVAMTPVGILTQYCGLALRTRFTPTAALATGNYIVAGELRENKDLS